VQASPESPESGVEIEICPWILLV